MARIRLDPRKSARPFKWIICNDVSEFESYMPSHAVTSLWAIQMNGLKQLSFHFHLMRVANGRADSRQQPEECCLLPSSIDHGILNKGRLTDPTTDHPGYIRLEASVDAISKAHWNMRCEVRRW